MPSEEAPATPPLTGPAPGRPDARTAPRFLVCPPDHFRIAYEINPWMDRRRRVDRPLARRQWNRLIRTLRRLGAAIERLDPARGSPDLVFTANAGLVSGRTFVRSNLRHAERRAEEAIAEAWFVSHGYEVVLLPRRLRFEGEGDALSLGRTLFFGYRYRSDIRSAEAVSEIVGMEALPLELVDRRFYHLDTCFRPLGPRSLLYYPGAFDRYALRVIRDRIPDLIPVSEAEACRFICNAIPIGRSIVVPRGLSDATRSALSARGFEPVEIDLSEYLKAGGAAKCLVLRLDGRPGGHDRLRL